MYTFLLTVHVLACLFLILVVLLQAGRGAGFAIFGGGGDAMFASPSGSSFLKKATMTLAGTFAATSLMLTLLSTRVGMRSVTQQDVSIPGVPAQQQPSGPAKVPAQPSAETPAGAAGGEEQ